MNEMLATTPQTDALHPYACLTPDAVLDALRETKEPGLTDRLIALDYTHQRATVLTLDRKMAALAGCERL